MEDKPFVIAHNCLSEGYPERKLLNVENFGERWYMLRDHPKRLEGMKFYKLVELPKPAILAEMDACRKTYEKQEHKEALAVARAEVRRLEAEEE